MQIVSIVIKEKGRAETKGRGWNSLMKWKFILGIHLRSFFWKEIISVCCIKELKPNSSRNLFREYMLYSSTAKGWKTFPVICCGSRTRNLHPIFAGKDNCCHLEKLDLLWSWDTINDAAVSTFSLASPRNSFQLQSCCAKERTTRFISTCKSTLKMKPPCTLKHWFCLN